MELERRIKDWKEDFTILASGVAIIGATAGIVGGILAYNTYQENKRRFKTPYTIQAASVIIYQGKSKQYTSTNVEED